MTNHNGNFPVEITGAFVFLPFGSLSSSQSFLSQNLSIIMFPSLNQHLSASLNQVITILQSRKATVMQLHLIPMAYAWNTDG